MKTEASIRLGGTGFQPVKSGILPDFGVTLATCISLASIQTMRRAGFGQDARNKRLEAGSTHD